MHSCDCYYDAEVPLYESPNLEILPSELNYNTYDNMAARLSSITKFGYYAGFACSRPA